MSVEDVRDEKFDGRSLDDSARLPLGRKGLDNFPGIARGIMAGLCTISAAFVIPVKYGFDLDPGFMEAVNWAETILAALFSFDLLLRWLSSPGRAGFLAEHKGEFGILALFLGALALFPAAGESFAGPGHAALIAVELYLALNVLLKIVSFERFLLSIRIRPIQVLVLSFVAIIILGTSALALLPNATSAGNGMNFIDALFTSTSAACVTGLTVVDTGTFFSPFGQVILLILMQLGGLGIMTFAAFFAMAIGEKMTMGEGFVIRDAMNVEAVGKIRRFLVSIFVATFAIEAAGALLIYAGGAGESHPAGNLWFSVFHSVAAFCNAGFGLNGDSLTQYRDMPGFNAVILGLVITGGLGFGVLADVFKERILPLGLLLLGRRGRRKAAVAGRLTSHSRIVLFSSLVLTATGAAGFLATEWGSSLSGLGAGGKVAASVFHSVSARTAGFNTVDIGAVGSAGLLVLMFLMFVGASPGSTGGGIKTSTFAVLCLAVWSVFRSREHVEVFKRRIPKETVNKALAIVFCALLLVFFASLFLACTEPGRPLRAILFEVVSAFGTVGLSTGITPDLSYAGKIIISLVMFAGRLGPITIVLALAAGARPVRYSYPEESVMIG